MLALNKINLRGVRMFVFFTGILGCCLATHSTSLWAGERSATIANGILFLDTNHSLPKKTGVQLRSERRARVMNTFANEDANAVDAFTHGFHWGMGLNTDGWRMTFRWERTVNPKNSYHIQAEFSEISDEHERVLTLDYVYNGYIFTNSGVIVDGKINIFYPLRVGFGWNHYITNKATHFKKGAFVQWFGNAGLIFGLQKPYNIEIIDYSSGVNKTKIIDHNAQTDVYYRSGNTSYDVKGRTFDAFFSGWDMLSINPGLFLEGGLRIGFSKRVGFVSNINFGLGVDIYAKSVPILLDQQARNFFYRAFIAFEIGNTKVKR